MRVATATGTTAARSPAGCDKVNHSMKIDIPVFWIPVSIAMAMMSFLSLLHSLEKRQPKAKPSQWAGWNLLMMHEYRWINRHQDQNWWANYKGIKEGPVKNPFKRKLF